MYTDGVIERRGHSLDDGLQQLSRILDTIDAQDSPDDICQQLIDSFFAIIASHDDRCVLVIQTTKR